MDVKKYFVNLDMCSQAPLGEPEEAGLWEPIEVARVSRWPVTAGSIRSVVF